MNTQPQSMNMNLSNSTISNDDLIVIEMVEENEVIEEMLCNTAY